MGLSIAQVVMSRKDRTVEEPSCTCRAFSRVDGLAVAFGLALLSLVVLPGLGQVSWRSERLQCLSNLRWIGRAFQVWGADHGDWRPWRTSKSEGGTWQSDGKVGNAWFEFACVSNQLITPRALVCPSDQQVRRVADDFSTRPNGGFVNVNYRGNSLSYFVALDTFPDQPRSVLAGDRHLLTDGGPVFCSSGINNTFLLRTPPSTPTVAAWTNGVHPATGNLLSNDGTVCETTTDELRDAIAASDRSGSTHLLPPR